MLRRLRLTAASALVLLSTITLFPAAASAAGVCACFFTEEDGRTQDCDTLSVNDQPSCNNACDEVVDGNNATVIGTPKFQADDTSQPGRALKTECDTFGQSITPAPTAPPVTDGNIILPNLSVDIPGVSFSKPLQNPDGTISVNYIGPYINGVYRFMLGASVTVAIVLVMVGGIQYVLAAQTGDVKVAKERIKNAVIGFVLLMSVYVVLYTVNPQLTLLNALNLTAVGHVPLEDIAGDEGTNVPAASATCRAAIENIKAVATCSLAEGFASPTGNSQPSCNYHFRDKNFDGSKITALDWGGAWDSAIKAPISGTIRVTKNTNTEQGCGNQITIIAPTGQSVAICHVKDWIKADGAALKTGDVVVQGDAIGHLGGRCCQGETVPNTKAFAKTMANNWCNQPAANPCDSPDAREADCTCQPVLQSGNTSGPHVHTTWKGKDPLLSCLK